MKVIDAYILARTKRKTRRIRMALVIIVSSLLFAVLFFGVLVFNGIQRSSSRFQEYRYNGRYITQLTNYGSFMSDESMRQATQDEMDAELRSRKVKVTDDVRNSPEYSAELAQRMSEKMTVKAKTKQVEYEKKMADKYQPAGQYHLKTISALMSLPDFKADDPDPYLTDQTKQIETGVGNSTGPIRTSEPSMFLSVEEEMIRPLLQSGQTFAWKQGEPYPVVLPYAYTERLAKKSFVGLGAAEKNAGYSKLMTDYTGKMLTYCYRNSTAQGQLEDVLKYNHKAKTDNDAATKPLPVEACKGFDQAVLKKAGLLAQEDSNAPKPLFPKPAAAGPDTRVITLKIVGFVPTLNQGPGTDIFTSLFSSVNSWPSNMPIIMPQAVVDVEPMLQQGGGTQVFFTELPTLYFEFTSRAQQKQFIEAEGCRGNDCYRGDDWIITPFGSIKTALEGVLSGIVKVGKWVALGIAALASLLVLFTISKLMSDNRREIAVFRALGARQRDIAQIYFTYGCMLAANALVVSLALAGAGSYVFSVKFADRFNASLVQAVGAYDNPGQSVLIGVQPLWLAAVGGLFFVAAMVGVAVPVLMGRRRNLVTIMREE